MQGIAEALQFAVVVERAGASLFELEAFQEIEFLGGGIAAHCRIAPEFLEARLFFRGRCVLRWHKLKMNLPLGREAFVQEHIEGECLHFDVPGIDHRVQKRGAVLNRQVEYIRVQELQNRGPHFFVGLAAKLGHAAQPVFVFQFSRAIPFATSRSVWPTNRSSSPNACFSKISRTWLRLSFLHFRRISSRISLNNGSGGSASFFFSSSRCCARTREARWPGGNFKNEFILSYRSVRSTAGGAFLRVNNCEM